MKIFNIKDTPAEQQYRGCGKAWAAIADGQVVAIRYMGDFQAERDRLPEWVRAVIKESSAIEQPSFCLGWLSPRTLGRIKKAAVAAGHPEFGPRGGHIKASDIAREARSIALKHESEQFELHRTRSRTELAKLGRVVSGQCSCLEFISFRDNREVAA